jgi:hypothetical protein
VALHEDKSNENKLNITIFSESVSVSTCGAEVNIYLLASTSGDVRFGQKYSAALIDTIIINYELKFIRKEAAVAYLNAY